MNKLIYLDHAATTPVYPEVVEAMMPYLTDQFGNASSAGHPYGWSAKEVLEKSRAQVAAFIGAQTNTVFFTSGATESCNWALKGFHQYQAGKSTLITQSTEHQAVLETINFLDRQRAKVSMISIDQEGAILMSDLEEKLNKAENPLVAVMAVNNETGVRQPIEKIAQLKSTQNFCFFCDATQAIGKIPFKINDLACDLMAFSAHKLGGPKGVGILFVSEELQKKKWGPLLHGGSQEMSLRAGTVNIPGIVGLAKALELNSKFAAEKIVSLRKSLEQKLVITFGVKINGELANRAPHILSAQFPKQSADDIQMKVNHLLAVSEGTACNTSFKRPSHVLKSMGMSDSEAYSTLRFSLGWNTNEQDIENTVAILKGALV